MRKILDKYDLNAILEVVQDREQDYSGCVQAQYEAGPGENIDVEREVFYPHGYGETLYQAVELLRELKEYKEEG